MTLQLLESCLDPAYVQSGLLARRDTDSSVHLPETQSPSKNYRPIAAVLQLQISIAKPQQAFEFRDDEAK
jgi:hypothetical protein